MKKWLTKGLLTHVLAALMGGLTAEGLLSERFAVVISDVVLLVLGLVPIP